MGISIGGITVENLIIIGIAISGVVFAMSASDIEYKNNKNAIISVILKKRTKGLEPSTSTLGRLHSTTELRPHTIFIIQQIKLI